MIETFSGEHRFLSNFYAFETPLVHRGVMYKSVEHFYVAMKSPLHNIRVFVASQKTAGEAKKVGKNIPLRMGWDKHKREYMLRALRYKFSEHNPILRQQLIDTGNEELQEGNYWKDTYWGVYLATGEGENILGELLMQVRSEILGVNLCHALPNNDRQM